MRGAEIRLHGPAVEMPAKGLGRDPYNLRDGLRAKKSLLFGLVLTW